MENFKINKKVSKKIGVIFIIVIIIILIGMYITYIFNGNFRNYLDKYVLRKNISTENLAKIDLNDSNNNVFAYDKYIAILNNNVLKTYSYSGKEECKYEVKINQILFDSNNKYLVLAQKNGNNFYVISGPNILWQKEIEGQISRVSINTNGYISVIVSGTSYKTVIITFNPDGKELFKTYLSNNSVEDVDISLDNKYLAIAEINTTGSILQSNLKILSIEKAQSDPSNAVEKIYNSDSNELILNIKYQEKNKLVCMYDDSIKVIQSDNEKLKEINEKDIFFDIELKDNIMKVSEKTSGLFSDIELKIIDINSKKEKLYTISGIPKTVYTKENVIALNLGTEVYFIDTNGWLIKKYSSNREIKDVILGSKIAGIIYKDKIEIINL